MHPSATNWGGGFCFLAAFTFLAPSAALAQIDPLGNVVETMMESQGAEGALIGRLFGPDLATTLQFTSNVDVAGQQFSFQSAPGSTYLNQPLQLLVNGVFDDQLATWTVQSQGSLGATVWQGLGVGAVQDNPGQDPGWIEELDWKWQIGPVLFDHHVKWTWALLETVYISSGEYKFTINNVVVATAKGFDIYDEKVWEWNVAAGPGFKTPVQSAGNSDPSGGAGSFEMRIIPEPSTGALALMAAGLLFFARRRFC